MPMTALSRGALLDGRSLTAVAIDRPFQQVKHP